MSMNVSTIARTVRIIKPYSNVQRTGRNGVWNSESVMFSIATDREYKSTVTHDDGTVGQERKTDFFACRATGPIARLFNQYCSAMKTDEQGNQKLVSRRLYIKGHLENYQADRDEVIQIEGLPQPVQVKLPDTRTIVVVESIEFLDADPVKKANAQAQATPVAYAQPIPAQGYAQPAPAVAPAPQMAYAQPYAQSAPAVAPASQPQMAMPAMPMAPEAIDTVVAPF